MNNRNLIWKVLLIAVCVWGGLKWGSDHWKKPATQLILTATTNSPKNQQVDEELLLRKAAEGDLDYVQKEISRGATVNAVTRQGDSLVSLSIKGGHWDVAEYCLAHGFSPQAPRYTASNPVDGHVGDSAVYWAVRQKRLDLLKKLLDAGADPDGGQPPIIPPLQPSRMASRYYMTKVVLPTKTPLAAAVELEDGPAIRELISKGAKVNGVVDEGASLLLLATRTRNRAILELLIDLKAVYQSVEQEYLALPNAVAANWPEGVEVLLKHGLLSYVSEDLLNDATKDKKMRDDIRCVFLAQHFKKSSFCQDPNLQKAAIALATSIVRGGTIGQSGSDPAVFNARDEYGWTALCYAIDVGKLEWVKVFVDRGASTNLSLLGGEVTPFALAVARGNLNIVQYLVSKGADMEWCQAGGTTPLEHAIEKGSTTVFDWLLAHGAHVEPPDGILRGSLDANLTTGWKSEPDGRPTFTPLQVAVICEKEYFVKRLIAAGANVHVRDNGGLTPVLMAAERKNAVLIRLLEAHGASLKNDTKLASPRLTKAFIDRDKETIVTYLELGVPMEPDAVDAAMGNPEMVKLVDEYTKKNNDLGAKEAMFWVKLHLHSDAEVEQLLASGGDPNFAGASTPLQQATLLGMVETVDILLRHGADPNKVGSVVSDAPIFSAISCMGPVSHDRRCAMLKMLLEHGANIEARHPPVDDSGRYGGRTPLMSAVMAGSPLLTRLLLDHGANTFAQDDFGKTVMDFLSQSQQLSETDRRKIRAWLSAEQQKNSQPRNTDQQPTRQAI
jgi:ankyrin repeat protein